VINAQELSRAEQVSTGLRFHVLRQGAISCDPQHEGALELRASRCIATPVSGDARPTKRLISSRELPAQRCGYTKFGLRRVLSEVSPAPI
jgi:hypothetical protein